MTESGKTCTKCGEWKPVEAFSPSKVGKLGRTTQCKECLKLKAREVKGYKAMYVRPSDPFIENNKGIVWGKQNGQYVKIIVDVEDLQKVSNINWSVTADGYVYNQNVPGTFMHRYLMGLDNGDPLTVNHKDFNPLNNSVKDNLELADYSENNVKKNITSTKSKAGFLGVSQYGKNGLYRARFTWKDDEHYMHGFNDPVAAAFAYDDLVRTYGPPGATLNFPDKH